MFNIFLFLSAVHIVLLRSHVSAEFYYPDCESAGMSCLDCNTRKMCLNFFGLKHWSDTSCANAVSGYSKPYCNPSTDECTNIRPDGCPSVTFIQCLRDGFFPDTSDCTAYYQCTNSSSESFTCSKNYIYKQAYGKCVFKLTDSDCVTVASCGLTDYEEQYPDDPSLYYGCKSSVSYLKACSVSEVYNETTGACESICTNVELLSISQSCSKYISCQENTDGIVAVEKSCETGYGFNPNALKCESGYENICNELAILENDIYDVISKIPIVRKLTNFIKKVMNFLKLNPAKIFLIFRLSDEDISTIILTIDYIYQNKKLPSTTIALIVNYVVEYLPPQVQFVVNIFRQLGILKLQASNRTSRSISEEVSLQSYLADVLSNTEIDLVAVIQNLQEKNTTEEVSAEIFWQSVKILKIPGDQVPMFKMALKANMPKIASLLNTCIGWPVFVSNEEGTLRLKLETIDEAFDDVLKILVSEVYPNNYLMSKVFQATAKQQYRSHHAELIDFVNNFSVNLDSV